MRIEQLKQIIEVEKHGSVSKAAEALFVAQPALSRSINALEDELHTEIFSRTSKGVVPTVSGKYILSQAKVILKEIEKLYQIEQDDSILVGDFHFMLVPALYNALFSDLLLTCNEKYSDLKPVFHNESYVEALRKICEMKIDIGIVYIPAFSYKQTDSYVSRIKNNSNLICEEIKSGKISACVSKESSIAQKEEVDFGEILNEKIIVQREDSLRGLGIDIKDCDYVVIEDDWQLLKTVLENKGCAIVPQFYFSNYIEKVKYLIREVPIEGDKINYYIYLIYKELYKTTSIIDVIRKIIQKLT